LFELPMRVWSASVGGKRLFYAALSRRLSLPPCLRVVQEPDRRDLL